MTEMNKIHGMDSFASDEIRLINWILVTYFCFFFTSINIHVLRQSMLMYFEFEGIFLRNAATQKPKRHAKASEGLCEKLRKC